MKFFNRELSWLSFNHRVLQEAEDQDVPLFERVKFLAIFSSNLEEFFRVRVASIRSLLRLKHKSIKELEFDPVELLENIHTKVNSLQVKFGDIFVNSLLPELRRHSIFLKTEEELSEKEIEFIKEFFFEKVYPFVNPMIIIKKKIKPFLRSGVLYLAVSMTSKGLKSKKKKYSYGIVEIPTDKIRRFVILPSEAYETNIIFLDDIIRYFLNHIFEGFNIEEVCSIKLTRDAEIYIDDEFSGNLLEKIKKGLSKRTIGLPSRFLYDGKCSKKILKFLRDSLSLEKEDMMAGARYHNFSDFSSFPHPYIKELEYEKLKPVVNRELDSCENIFDAIDKKNYLLNFPYESYDPVLRFLKEASEDKRVEEIKITLYRVAKDSAIIKYLLSALKNRKRVTIFVEVKARFDEEANIQYASELESAGAKILYSLPGLKVHSKMCLVARVENGVTKNYSYLSTGNFNEKTASIYSDFGFFTADLRINEDVKNLFNTLERKTDNPEFRKLLVAGHNFKKAFSNLIDIEIENAKAGKDSGIILKLNSIEDKKMIEKLYEASNSGVKINLIVRGVCCLVPGVKGMSENINVISIVDRFLEHSRIMIFANGGDAKIYLSSADLMKRNLSRRIEVAFPIEDADLKNKIMKIVSFQLEDSRKARVVDEFQTNNYVETSNRENISSQLRTYQYLSAPA